MTRRPPARAGQWLSVPFPKPDARVRLFCVPFAGGGASAFYTWSRALRERPIDVCAVQLPGRENRLRETPLTSLGAAVDAIGDAVRPLTDIPYAIFGHSMGALLAYELSRRIVAAGEPRPVHLFVSGAQAPDVPADQPPLHVVSDDDAFVRAVAERYGGIPPMVMQNDELKRLVLPALRADLTMTESYCFEPGSAPLPVDITAYAGAADERASEEKVVRWRDRTAGRFAYRIFEGDHFFLTGAREVLLADVTTRLAPHL